MTIVFFHSIAYQLLGKQREASKVDSLNSDELTRAYIRNGLSETNEQRLLVLFLYNTTEEMRLLRMHPEMMQGDTTHGTNKEKKELFTIASTDGNNNAFSAARAYIPNAQRWVFTTLFADCLPKFFGKLITKRNYLFLTDGCSNEYSSFIANTGKGHSFPNSVLGLCYFHLASLGWNRHVQPNIDFHGKKAAATKKCVTTIKYWVKSWFYDVESESEYFFSRQLFFAWLEAQKNSLLSELGIEKVKWWIRTTLDPHGSLWLNYLRLRITGFNQRTTSVGEAMHSSMKNKRDGASANMEPKKSTAKIIEKSNSRMKKLGKHNAICIDRSRINNTEEQGSYLTDHGYKIAEAEYEMSKSCRCVQIDSDTFHAYTPDNEQKVKGIIYSK